MLYNTNGIDSCNGTRFRIRWKINILFNNRTSIFYLMRNLVPLHDLPFAICIISPPFVSFLLPERLSALLPDDSKERAEGLLFRRDFDLSYRLDCQHLFADFKENIEFKFSLGITALMNRFLGPKGARSTLAGLTAVVSINKLFV